MLTYISINVHYKEVFSRAPKVKQNLWNGTAGIKGLYMEVGKQKTSFLAVLIRRGVEVRLIHVKEPAPNFKERI